MTTGAPDHFKRILLYGLYNGAATPLACDEQGRLILVTEPVSPLDKSGTILMRDDFSDGLVHVKAGGSGTGYSVALNDDEAFRGGYSCKLTGGSDSARSAEISYYLSSAVSGKIGVEFVSRFISNVEYLYLDINLKDGSQKHTARLRLDYYGYCWEIYDYGTDSWVKILENVVYSPVTNYFYRFKLVVDLDNDVYHRFNAVQQEIELSAYELDVASDTKPAQLWARLQIVSTAGNNGAVYLDNVIITQDES